MDVCTRQRVVIELLIAQGSNWIHIQRHLRSVYGEDAIDVSSVRCWISHFKSSEKDIGDRPCSSSAQSFMRLAESILRKGGKSVLIMKEETLWKNNLNFIKDVPMMYVNFIITVIIVLKKK